MRRNSNTLFLDTGYEKIPVPWVDDAPDFSGFSEPTLGVLQETWQAFLASGEELEVIPDPEPPPPEPDWLGFIIEFSLPGNSLYNATATKIQASGEVAKEHWSNLKLGLNISEIRSIEWLQLSYTYILYLLEINNNPLSIEEKQSWVNLANKYNITIE